VTRFARGEGEKLVKMFKRRHFDITMKETLPDAGKQFEALKRKLKSLETRVRTLEKQVQPIYAEHKAKELQRVLEDDNSESSDA